MKKILFFCLLAIALASAEVKQNAQIFTDSRDGKKYKIVKIGTQTWMAENLNYNAEGSKCYDNKTANCDKYGRLYDWNTAMKVCPKGWHLSSIYEWYDILLLLNTTVDSSDIHAKYLKATNGWNDYNGTSGNGEDTYGFAALPGGYGNSNGSFKGIGNYGLWWNASDSNDKYAFSSDEYAFSRVMQHSDEYVDTNYDYNNQLYSVRCLQD